jgi:DNA-binding MarR family transcriptional regulator
MRCAVSTSSPPTETMTRGDDPGRRIALAWREMRRGSSTAQLRAQLTSPDGPSLEQAQLDALEILGSEQHGWRMTEFADAMRVEPSTATRAIDRLQRLGLAERSVDADDGRVVRVTLSTVGRRTQAQVRTRRAEWMERLLEPFTPAEREQLAGLLERFVNSIDRLAEDLARQQAGAEHEPRRPKG